MPEVSGTNITHYMKGINFPATKQECIDWARKNGADEGTLKALSLLSDGKQFQSMADLMQDFGLKRRAA